MNVQSKEKRIQRKIMILISIGVALIAFGWTCVQMSGSKFMNISNGKEVEYFVVFLFKICMLIGASILIAALVFYKEQKKELGIFKSLGIGQWKSKLEYFLQLLKSFKYVLIITVIAMLINVVLMFSLSTILTIDKFVFIVTSVFLTILLTSFTVILLDLLPNIKMEFKLEYTGSKDN